MPGFLGSGAYRTTVGAHACFRWGDLMCAAVSLACGGGVSWAFSQLHASSKP